MKAGGWPSIIAIFLFGVLGGSTVSKLFPLGADVGHALHVSPSQFGWLISLIAVPAALLAIPSGIVVDRFGPKRVMLAAACLALVADAIYVFSHSLGAFEIARLIEGAAIVHIYSAGPALMMSTTEGRRRTMAMTVWAAYMPMGTAAGLVIGGIFAGSAGWRMGFSVHGALLLLVAALGLMLPKSERIGGPAPTLAQRVVDLRLAYSRPPLLLLGLSVFLMIVMGLGANTVLPGFIARAQGLSMSGASGELAMATLAMAPGSILTGLMLGRAVQPRRVFLGVAAFAFCVGALAFFPGLGSVARFVVLCLWFVATGAAMAIAVATLPVIAEPERRGAAAAALNQSGSLATFVAPPLWLTLASGWGWTALAALLAGGWLLTALCMWLATAAAPGAPRLAPSRA